MASVTLEHLSKTYSNGFVSVNDVSLHVDDGEFITFHGPSGCGKSTILRMIGGLEDITSGKIYLGDELLNDILPRDRRLAMAFQNYTLYKHFNAYDNMALGLRLRDLPRNIIDNRVNDAARLLGISGVLNQKIKSLSERDKQKVALGRAIVCHPKVLLVDEDFARQDPERRKEMLCDILEINEELKITVLYVTNDPLEARTLGKKIVFMKDGKITDIGEPPISVILDVKLLSFISHFLSSQDSCKFLFSAYLDLSPFSSSHLFCQSPATNNIPYALQSKVSSIAPALPVQSFPGSSLQRQEHTLPSAYVPHNRTPPRKGLICTPFHGVLSILCKH